MQETKMSEQESLLLIQQMINRAINDFVDRGIGPLVRGAFSTFCSV